MDLNFLKLYNVIGSEEERRRNLGAPLLEPLWKTLNPFHYLLRSFKVVLRSDNRGVLVCLLTAFGFTVCAVLGEFLLHLFVCLKYCENVAQLFLILFILFFHFIAFFK